MDERVASSGCDGGQVWMRGWLAVVMMVDKGGCEGG